MSAKLSTFLIAALVVLVAQYAQAKEGDKSVEGTLDYGTQAFSGLGGQAGVTAGFGYELRNNLQGRVDLSYYKSSKGQMEVDVTGKRVPVDLGVRYYYPLQKIDRDLRAYGQGGVEISYDEWHTGPFTPLSSGFRFGVAVGGGAEYALTPEFGAVVNLQYHIIQNGYLSAGLGMAYHF